MDPITIGLLAGGGLGALQGGNNEKKMYQDAMLKANLAQYAPYSQMAANIASQPGKDLPDQTASMFSGAATGASAGNLFGKAAAPAAGGSAGAMGASSAPKMDYAGANMFGGQDMSAQLGAQYGMPGQFDFQPKYLAMK